VFRAGFNGAADTRACRFIINRRSTMPFLQITETMGRAATTQVRIDRALRVREPEKATGAAVGADGREQQNRGAENGILTIAALCF